MTSCLPFALPRDEDLALQINKLLKNFHPETVSPLVRWVQVICELVPKGFSKAELEEMGEGELTQILTYYREKAEYEAEVR